MEKRSSAQRSWIVGVRRAAMRVPVLVTAAPYPCAGPDVAAHLLRAVGGAHDAIACLAPAVVIGARNRRVATSRVRSLRISAIVNAEIAPS